MVAIPAKKISGTTIGEGMQWAKFLYQSKNGAKSYLRNSTVFVDSRAPKQLFPEDIGTIRKKVSIFVRLVICRCFLRQQNTILDQAGRASIGLWSIPAWRKPVIRPMAWSELRCFVITVILIWAMSLLMGQRQQQVWDIALIQEPYNSIQKTRNPRE